MNFRIFFSVEDGEWVGVCDEYPSLSWLAVDPEVAAVGIIAAVRRAQKDMGIEEI
jgi:hypothetical protein